MEFFPYKNKNKRIKKSKSDSGISSLKNGISAKGTISRKRGAHTRSKNNTKNGIKTGTLPLLPIRQSQVISRGSYGIVEEGIIKINFLEEVRCARKIVGLSTEKERDAFCNEVEILHRCKHPNVVKMYNFGVSCVRDYSTKTFKKPKNLRNLLKDNRSVLERRGGGGGRQMSGFLEMELCDTDLRTTRPNNPHDKLCCAIQAAEGVKYIHNELGVVHRDLKPGNLLVKDGVVKLCDFGSSKGPTDVTNSLVGTILYLAPELLFPGKDVRVSNPKLLDVYSFGILMWELWSGVVPYEALIKGLGYQHEINLGFRVLTEGLRPNILFIADAPPQYRQLVIECWAHDPEKRPQSFDEILRRLKGIKVLSGKKK
jgi:serine/threonine protein kinase